MTRSIRVYGREVATCSHREEPTPNSSELDAESHGEACVLLLQGSADDGVQLPIGSGIAGNSPKREEVFNEGDRRGGGGSSDESHALEDDGSNVTDRLSANLARQQVRRVGWKEA